MIKLVGVTGFEPAASSSRTTVSALRQHRVILLFKQVRAPLVACVESRGVGRIGVVLEPILEPMILERAWLDRFDGTGTPSAASTPAGGSGAPCTDLTEQAGPSTVPQPAEFATLNIPARAAMEQGKSQGSAALRGFPSCARPQG
jgi:hypothetical protein